MRKRKGFSLDLKEVLNYNKDTGLFWWTEKSRSFLKYGDKPAGSINKNGYRYIGINKKRQLAHRLAWFFVYGEWPKKGEDIDHINGDRDDNRISNLRLLDRCTNLANSDVSSGRFMRGVQPNGNGYMAKIRYRNKSYYLGTFQTVEEASNAYLSKRSEFHQIKLRGDNEN